MDFRVKCQVLPGRQSGRATERQSGRACEIVQKTAQGFPGFCCMAKKRDRQGMKNNVNKAEDNVVIEAVSVDMSLDNPFEPFAFKASRKRRSEKGSFHAHRRVLVRARRCEQVYE